MLYNYPNGQLWNITTSLTSSSTENYTLTKLRIFMLTTGQNIVFKLAFQNCVLILFHDPLTNLGLKTSLAMLGMFSSPNWSPEQPLV